MPLDSSPSPILLQDLKVWQDDYDNLFKKYSDATKERSSREPTIPKAFSPNELQNVPDNWDQKAISPSKPFNQLLEERLAEETPVQIVNKPKRPFLRKGDGLARFRMSSASRRSFSSKQYATNGVRSKFTSSKSKKPESVPKRIQYDLSEEVRDKPNLKSGSPSLPSRGEIDFTPLEIPDFIKPRGTWHTVFNRDDQPAEGTDSHQIIKGVELNAISNDAVDKNVDEYTLSQLVAKQSLNLATSNDIPDRISKVSSHRFNQSAEISERELRLFEVLEKRADHASFSSTNTSILNLLSSTPHRSVKQETASTEPNEPHFFGLHQKLREVTKNTDVLQNFLLNLKRLGCEKLPGSDSGDSFCSPNAREHVDLVESSAKTSVRSFSDDERWSSRSPSPITAGHTECDSECQSDDASRRIDVAVNTSFNCTSDETIREECSQCEQFRLEIRQLQTDNKKLKAKAGDLETKNQRLEREAKKTNQNHLEAVGRLKEELEAERKKFAREKTIFETYVKEAQNRPTKQERAEITRLKQELADTKELMKLKDSKSGATQARLRTQLRQLEKETGELKVTVEKLQKENAKLSANQRLARRPAEVKMLHEINKNLSRLTEGALKKQLDKSGSGDFKEGKENKEGDIDRDKPPKNRKSKDEGVGNTESDIEQRYEHVFGKFDSPRLNGTTTTSGSEKTERRLENGAIEIHYGNGNTKTISPDGNLITVKYFNGDVKETNVETNTVRYHYAESDSWQVQYADGSEMIEYKDPNRTY
ncbi:centromere protein J isoform X2 [Cylas formicarius]|uniref:centromere protein J isoform X2 n=1 Tax=Cylas formicarius TaxID=197179 RepID=UPI002958814C|nr:centromere protein J isoform X2 [Cylas formicarius]